MMMAASWHGELNTDESGESSLLTMNELEKATVELLKGEAS